MMKDTSKGVKICFCTTTYNFDNSILDNDMVFKRGAPCIYAVHIALKTNLHEQFLYFQGCEKKSWLTIYT